MLLMSQQYIFTSMQRHSIITQQCEKSHELQFSYLSVLDNCCYSFPVLVKRYFLGLLMEGNPHLKVYCHIKFFWLSQGTQYAPVETRSL